MKVRILLLVLSLSALLAIGQAPALASEVTVTEITPFQYDAAFGFFEGFGRVWINGEGWGYIDTAGNLITPCQYETAIRFHDGLAGVKDKNRNCGLIDTAGREVVPCQYWGMANHSEGLIPVRGNDGLWGILDSEGEEVLPCVLDYDSVDEFHEGLSIVVKNGKKGAIDATGQEVIPCTMDYVSVGWFSEGRARVLRNGKWGFIDKTGQEIISCQWDGEAQAEFNYIEAPFSNGLARVRDYESGLWGYVDKTGSLVIPCKYGWAYTFYEGLAAVRDYKSGLWGFIDPTGREVVPCQYFCAKNYSDGLVWVWNAESNEERRYGVVDSVGREIIPCVLEYYAVTEFFDGTALVENKDHKWGVISLSGYKPTTTADSSTPPKVLTEYTGPGGDVVIPSDVTSIGESAFELCDSLISVDIPDSVTSIGELAFADCINLTSVTISGSVTSIGNFAFLGCNSLTNVTILNGNVEIGEEVFLGQDRSSHAFYPLPTAISAPAGGKVETYCKENNLTFVALTEQTTVSAVPTDSTAYTSTQSVLVDGFPVEFQCYALKDANGNDTNYIKLRDMASILNGTAAQFNVGWDGQVNIETGKDYTSNGSEMRTPFSGDRAYRIVTDPTNVNGLPTALDAIVLKDDQGGAYTYYKLRDLGKALGFRVDWDAKKGVFIETR